jgi:hypothetical protein
VPSWVGSFLPIHPMTETDPVSKTSCISDMHKKLDRVQQNIRVMNRTCAESHCVVARTNTDYAQKFGVLCFPYFSDYIIPLVALDLLIWADRNSVFIMFHLTE